MSLLNKEVIKVNIECSDWIEAIKEGTTPLINNGSIDKSYEDAIINNFLKLGPYMVIAPGIVLSHARPENGVNKLSLSLVTLKNPINFGSELNDPVKLVITLAASDNQTHLKALEELMELLMNSKDLNNLMKAEQVEGVIDIVTQYSIGK